MGIAPLVAAWPRMLRNLPGPLQGASLPGINWVPLPTGRLIVEIAWGADPAGNADLWSWTDVTSDVQVDGGAKIATDRGLRDEAQQSTPATFSCRLDNRLSAYSKGPKSRNYPNVKLNVPVRFRVDAGSGAEIQFQGYSNGFKPGWDTTGNYAIVTLNASGSLRRLGLLDTPVSSPMSNSIVAARPVSYFPMEDAVGSSQFQSGIANDTRPVIPSGSITYAANNNGLLGSMPLPTMSATTSLAQNTFHTFTGHWQVDWYTEIPAIPATDTILMRMFSTGGIAYFDLVLTATGFHHIYGYDNFGVLVIDSGAVALPSFFIGQWIHLRLMVKDTGGSITWLFGESPIMGSGSSFTGTFATTLGNFASWYVPPQAGNAGIAIGHIAVYDDYNFSATDSSARAYGPDTVNLLPGEITTIRLARICIENSIPLEIIGAASSFRMGPQPIANLMTILRDIETTEGGKILDGFGPGLRFYTSAALQNQDVAITVDANNGAVLTFDPEDDDQQIANMVKVTRSGGSSAISTVTGGNYGTSAVLDYSRPFDVNFDFDTNLQARADWLTHQGTTLGDYRYPQVDIAGHNDPTMLTRLITTQPLNRWVLRNVPQHRIQHPDGDLDLLILGISQQWDKFTADMTVSQTNYSGYKVAEYSDITGDTNEYLGRYDTDDSTLNGDHALGATTLSVTSPSTGLWTVASDDFTPEIAINVGGWRLLVTGITGGSTPQTVTLDASTPLPAFVGGGTKVSLWEPSYYGE